jgi:tRNA dimethylallyltransferase
MELIIQNRIDVMSVRKNIVVLGPTASGKTKFAIAVSQHFGLPIVNTDTQQFGPVHVLTASPTQEELDSAPHLLFNYLNDQQKISLGDWIQAVHQLPYTAKILVGGNGFYINSLKQGILLYDVKNNSTTYTFEDLKRLVAGRTGCIVEQDRVIIDSTVVHQNDQYRIQQQSAFISETGCTYRTYARRYTEDMFIICIIPDKAVLYERIITRTKKMLPEAIQELQNMPHADVYNTIIGYKEIRQYLAGNMTYAMLEEKVNIYTYQYAKKQLKFLKKIKADITIDDHTITCDQAIAKYLQS